MKRGQVTIFILLGLVILIGIALFAFLSQEKTKQTQMKEPHVDEVPATYSTMQEYVISCVRKIGKEGVKKAGQHGGYINISDPTYTSKSFEKNIKPTNSDVVYLSDMSHPVPYYWHMETDNKCRNCQVSTQKIPTLENIEKQVGKYVDNNIDACLGDMNELKVMGFSVEREAPETNVEILENKVIVQTNYPMKASFNDTATQNVEKFGVDLQVPFLKSYTMAVHLTTKQAKEQYLETAALSLVSFYSGLDSNKLPPISHVDEGYNTVKWVKTAVKQKFRKLLVSYLPMFRVEGTENGEKIQTGSRYQNAYFGHTFLENNITMQDSTVNFLFLDWPIYFDITPSNGELLEPSSFKNSYPFDMIPPTQTNHYEFFYDFSFPVVVDISSPEAFKNEGFDFMFAMEGNVRDNKNLLKWYQGEGTIGPWDYDNTNQKANENTLPNANESKLESLQPKESLICDDNQQVAGPVKIKAEDSYIKRPVEGASVTFKCGDYKSCNLGQTSKQGILKTKIPLCKGGGIVISKEGYRTNIIGNVTNELNKSVNYDVVLERLKEKTIQVKKIPYTSLKNTEGIAHDRRKELLENETLDLLPREKVMLSFTKKKEKFYETKFTRSVQIKGNQTAEIELLTGEYKVRASLIDRDGVITKRVNKNYSNGRTVTYPSVNMTPAMLGGARLNTGTGLLKVTEKDLEKPSSTFYVIGYSPPEIITDMKYMGNMEKHSKKYRRYLEPEFS